MSSGIPCITQIGNQKSLEFRNIFRTTRLEMLGAAFRE